MTRFYRTGSSWLVLVPLLACCLAIQAVANCTMENCDDRGPIEVGCGSGENLCVGGSEAECEGDTARSLSSGPFECGVSEETDGECNCRTSSEDMDLCYTDYDGCDYDNQAETCFPDEDQDDPHLNWIKTSDDCS